MSTRPSLSRKQNLQKYESVVTITSGFGYYGNKKVITNKDVKAGNDAVELWAEDMGKKQNIIWTSETKKYTETFKFDGEGKLLEFSLPGLIKKIP